MIDLKKLAPDKIVLTADGRQVGVVDQVGSGTIHMADVDEQAGRTPYLSLHDVDHIDDRAVHLKD